MGAVVDVPGAPASGASGPPEDAEDPAPRRSTRALETVVALVVIAVLFWVVMTRVVLVPPEVRDAPVQEFGALPVQTRVLAAGIDLAGLEVTGTLAARQRVVIAAERGGRVVRVAPDWRPGRQVRAGEELFAVDAGPAELAVATAQARVAEAQAALELARVDVTVSADALPLLEEAAVTATRVRERLGRLLETGEASPSMVDEALAQEIQAKLGLQGGQGQRDRAVAAVLAAEGALASASAGLAEARDGLARHAFHAPFAGELAGSGPPLGSLRVPGNPLDTLTDPAHLALAAWIHESDLARALPGADVHVELPARPGLVLKGTLVGRAPEADPLTRNVALEIGFDPGDVAAADLPAGIFARGVVAAPNGGRLPAALWLHRSELVWARGTPLAFVARTGADGALVAHPIPLQLGLEVGEGYVVGSGLAAGDRLITAPLDRLATEGPSPVALAPAVDAGG